MLTNEPNTPGQESQPQLSSERAKRKPKTVRNASSGRAETLVSVDLGKELKDKVRELAIASNLSIAEYLRGIVTIAAKKDQRVKLEFTEA